MKPEKKLLRYVKYFDEGKLFKKLKRISGIVSINLLYYILILFYLTSDSNIPIKIRIIFIAALGYLILPTDLVSDFIPGLGFTDDIAFITYAISSATNYITPEIQDKALNKLSNIVGPEGIEKVNFKKFFNSH